MKSSRSNSCNNLEEQDLSQPSSHCLPNHSSTSSNLQLSHEIDSYLQEERSRAHSMEDSPRLSRQTQVNRAIHLKRKSFALLKNERLKVNINDDKKPDINSRTSLTNVCLEQEYNVITPCVTKHNIIIDQNVSSLLSNNYNHHNINSIKRTKVEYNNLNTNNKRAPLKHLVVGPNLSWSPTPLENNLETKSRLYSSQLLRVPGISRSLRVRKWVEGKFTSIAMEEDEQLQRSQRSGNSQIKRMAESSAVDHSLNDRNDLGEPGVIPKQKKTNLNKVSRATDRRRRNRTVVVENISIESNAIDDEKSHSWETNLDQSDCVAWLNVTQEDFYTRRILALKDKLSSKGQPPILLEFLKSHKYIEAIRHAIDGHSRVKIDICLLWSCLHGNLNLTKLCLSNDAVANARDAEGFSSLHLAAFSGSKNIIELLVNEGARVIGPASWDNKGEYTPLMLAAKNGFADIVSFLIQSGADIDSGLHVRSVTPLHYAVHSGNCECVQLLINAGATINPLRLYSETPLHIATEEGFSEIVEILLKHGADVRASRGANKVTCLHLSTLGNFYHITCQLLKAGADLNQQDVNGRTPLHIAAKSQCYDTVQVLLSYNADPNAKDCDGKTPLHTGIFKSSRNFECLKLLLEAGSDPNISNDDGYTPLHLAALNDSGYCVKMFLKHGGDLTKVTKGGVSALNIILRRTPTVITHIQENLNNAISHIDHDQQFERDGQIQLDFSVLLAGSGGGSECKLMSSFIKEGQKSFLRHPLCETFLFLKWSRVRTFFVFNLIFYMILVLALTQYFYMVFTDTPDYHNEQAKMVNKTQTRFMSKIVKYFQFEYDCMDISPRYHDISNVLLFSIWIMLTFLIIKEGFQALDSPKSYLSTLDNILVWPVIVGSLILTLSLYHTQRVCPWQYHVSALVTLVSWFELLLLVGRFPLFGLYVHMFAQVTKNFGKFLFTYICLINAFSSSFGILFHNQPPFKHRLIRLLKTLVMMTGEIEYDQWFYESKDKERILYTGTAHFVFALFLIFGTIILMNLLVGLAVSDIQGLQKSAGLDRLVRQTELIADFETFMFSRLLTFLLPKKFLKILHNRILLLNLTYGNKFILNPKTLSSSRIPPELIESIKRMARNLDHFSRRRNAFADFRTLSNSAQLSGDIEGDLSRGVEAIRCGLEVLVWDTEDQHEEIDNIMKKLNSLSTMVQDLAPTKSQIPLHEHYSSSEKESNFISCKSKCKCDSECKSRSYCTNRSVTLC